MVVGDMFGYANSVMQTSRARTTQFGVSSEGKHVDLRSSSLENSLVPYQVQIFLLTLKSGLHRHLNRQTSGEGFL